MSNIVNLTPHALHIERMDGTVLVVPPSGVVPRLSVTITQCQTLHDEEWKEDGVHVSGIAVTHKVFGAVDGMPAPSWYCGDCGYWGPKDAFLGAGWYQGHPNCPQCKGWFTAAANFVVSALCAEQLQDRDDVYAPGEAVRDSEGRQIGWKGLSRVRKAGGAQ